MLKRLAPFATALALLAAGCGDDGGGASGAASAIPPDPAVYVEADISGEGEQADNLEATLAEFGQVPLLGSALDPRALIDAAIEDLGQSSGIELSYAEDFEPWLGDRAAVGFTSVSGDDPSFVLSIETSDEEIARDSVNRITEADAAEETEQDHDGVEYKVSGSGEYAIGVFDEKLVLATVDEFENAIDASRGESVAGSDEVEGALDAIGSDRLAAVYVDAAALLDLAVEEGEVGPAEADAVRAAAPEVFDRPVVAALGAGEGSLYLDLAIGHRDDAPELGGSEGLAEVPEDAFAAIGLGSLGDQLDPLLDRLGSIAGAKGESLDREAIGSQFEAATGVPLDDALASLGDVVAYGRGDLPASFSAQADLEVADRELATELVDSLAELAGEDDDTIVRPALGGSEAGFSAEPKPRVESPVRFVNVELDEELSLLVASDRQAAAEGAPAGTLGETELFGAAEAALGSEQEMIAFADLGPILDAAIGPSSLLDVAAGEGTPEQAIAGFFADKLGFAAAGIRYEDGFAIQRLAVGLR